MIFANGLHERMRIRVLLRLQEGPPARHAPFML